jgi:threonine-phosphate decarboxylase
VITGHGGNIYEAAVRLGCDPTDIVDMSSNLNPLGPPEGLVDHLKNRMDAIISLPEVNSLKITGLLAERYGIPAENVLAGNGTTQLIYAIPRALGTRNALVVGPSYADYKDACALNGASCSHVLTREADGFRPDMTAVKEAVSGSDTVFICNPNNPTGVLWDDGDLESLCRSFPETVFIVDESYLPFAGDSTAKSAVRFRLPNVMVLNSMSKVFRIPGLRVGFVLAPVALIYRLESFILPWSVNALAQEAVTWILGHRTEIDRFLETTWEMVTREKERFIASLSGNPNIVCYPGATYFVLARLTGTFKAPDLCEDLLRQRILIRNCANFIGLDDTYVRFSLKDPETNMRLSERINDCLR